MKFIVLLSLLVSASAWSNNCAKDAAKFCQGTDPGKGQLAKCLSDYENQLSSACANELKDFKKNTAKKNPCFEDLAEYCEDIPAEAQFLNYCLLKNETRLSENCSADFKKKKGNLIVKDVCAQDIANICYKEVSGPEGAINRCLIRNVNKLSGFCKKNTENRIATLRKNNPCFDATEKLCPTQVKFIDIQECLEKKMPQLPKDCQKLVQYEQKKAQSNPCYKDLLRHCRMGINPQEQHRCLTVNENEISNACRQFRVKEEEKIKKMVDVCEADRLKICPDAPFKDGQVLKCLMKNKTKLSKECASLI